MFSPRPRGSHSGNSVGPVSAQTLVLGAVLAIIAAIYLQAALFDFAYDDFGQIVYNPGIQSWYLALKYFTSQVWAQVGGISYYYRPVFMLWLRANYALVGLHPLYWHLSAIALHLLSCLLLYFFIRRLTEDYWTPTVTVLLFGLHPAHVEAVAWISGSTETMMAILLLGSLLCYQKQLDSGRSKAGWRAASVVLAALALLTKETAIVLPAVIFSYEWIFRGVDRHWKTRLWSAARAAVPYAVVSLGFVALRTLALKRLTPPRTSASLLSVVLAWPEVMMFYAGRALAPFRMGAFYKPLLVKQPGLWNFFVPLFLLLAAATVLVYGSRRSRVCAFLGIWCAVLLVPLLGLTLSYNVENIHDRYLYLPSAAWCVLLAALLARLKDIHRGGTALVVLALIGGWYVFVTIQESRYWKNDIALGQHSLEVSPGNPLAAQLVGNAYIRDERFREAIPYLLDSLEALPDNADTLRSLGRCYSEIDALSLAEECLTKSMARNSSRPETHLLLGVVCLKQKRLDEAEAEIRRAVEVQNRLAPGRGILVHYYLGNILYAKGDRRGAVSEYQMELCNDPTIDPGVAKAKEQIQQIEQGLDQP
jgi:tetratricopeptide (TPR) repeat protein